MDNASTDNAMGMNGQNSMEHASKAHSDMKHGGYKKEGSFVDPMAHMNDPVQKLIDSTKHTHTAIKNGAWSDPSTWSNGKVPDDNARVLIKKGTVVTYDQVSDARIETVSIEGNLKFATNKDTQLKVETILNGDSGSLDIGSAGNSVAANKRARIIFTSDSAVDTKWDPKQLSKGLVSHGSVSIHGAEKADKLTLAGDLSKGASVLRFKESPTGWQVGDRIVVGGTNYNARGKDSDNSRFQDEVLTITSIQGREVRFVNEDIKSGNRNVLRFDHERSNIAGSADRLDLYVGNLTRNVTFETENGKDVPINRRAHVMLMHNPDISVLNAGFYELGRSDKTKLVDDPGKNVDGSNGKGTNARGRYALHLHRTGTDNQAAIVRGNAVEGSPGWGIVQHDAHAGLEDNVVFDVVGAGIAAEAGNEVGWWTDNLTIKTTGIPVVEFNRQTYVRDRLYDFGVQGNGFWVQGAAQIKNKDNKAISSNREGLSLFGGALNRNHLQDATTLEISSLPKEIQKLFPPDQKEVDIRDVPMATVEGFEAYNGYVGIGVWGHKTNRDGELDFNTDNPQSAHEGRSLIKDFKVWGNRFRGVSVQYSSNIDVKDGLVLGNESGKLRAFGAGLLNNQASYGTRFDNLTVAGFEVGADVALPNTDKEFISSTISNTDFSSNTYNLAKVGVPTDQGGLNDYAAYLKLVNNKFEADTASNKAPEAKFDAKAVGGLALELDASDSMDADPLRGGNPNLSRIESKGIAAYGWDLDGNGTIDRFGREITHVFDGAGNKNIGLTVWDSQGKTTTLNQRINVQPSDYENAFVNGNFSSSRLQISGNDNSQWADQGWFASKGVKVVNGSAKISKQGDRSDYIGNVTRNDKVHRGQQTLSYDLKNIDAGKSPFHANEVTVTFWGVNGQFENSGNASTGPFQVGTLPMERSQLYSKTFNKQNNGLFDWKTITADVNLGKGYDYLLFQVNAEKTNDTRDFVAVDNLSLAGKAKGNAGAPAQPVPPTPPTDPSPAPPPTNPNPTQPLPPSQPISANIPSPIAHLTFDEGRGRIAADSSSAGRRNGGRLQNGAKWVDGKIGDAVELNGKASRVSLNNSKDINLGTHPERTISMWFKAEETSGDNKQVLYEEGGRNRGLNMYIEDDSLIMGGWSQKGNWAEGDWIETSKIRSNKWHHVALVLDGENTLQPNALKAYLDGKLIGSKQGTQMWQHNDRIGVGNSNGSTRFADGTLGRHNKAGLLGGVDELQIFNDALSAGQVQQLASGGLA